jgi:hypothetical protein
MGCEQGEQPMIREEGIGPSSMVCLTSSYRRPLFLLAQDSSQPSADHLVDPAEQAWPGVFEVAEPSPKHRVEVSDDPFQAIAPASNR